MLTRTVLASALMMGTLSPAAFAQTTTARPQPSRPAIERPDLTRPGGIIARQRLQHRRIQSGQRRGTISTFERSHLIARQRQLRALTQRLRASGGRLDVRERLRLHRQLNLLSRNIRRFGRS